MAETPHIPPRLALGALALSLLTTGAGADAPPNQIAPLTPPDPVLHDRAPDGPAIKARHLDTLFLRLSDKDNPDWQAVQRQIVSAWSDSGSPSMNLLLSRAARAMEQEDYDTALLYLDDLVRLAPDFAEGWNKRATVYFLQERYGRSVADIRRVLALEPRHFGALAGLGIILDRLGDEAAALRVFRRALEIHPNLEGASTGVERLAPEVEGRTL